MITGGLLAGDLRDWVKAAAEADCPNCQFDVGPFIADLPDELCVVSLTGGSGSVMEGLFDNPTFQIRYRGQQLDFDSAQNGARVVDHALLSAEMVSIAGVPGLAFIRTGGPPDPDMPDNGGRTSFICNYAITIGSTL